MDTIAHDPSLGVYPRNLYRRNDDLPIHDKENTMKTMDAFMRGQANRGNPHKVFDWNKAARLIKECQPIEASAGLQSDWEYTGGLIWRDGKPVPVDDTYTYLASNWAMPELEMDGMRQDCHIMEDEVPEEWGGTSGVYWPQSALDILDSND